MDGIEIYKKRIEPFIGLGILIMLLFLGILLFQENKLQEKISEDCGWEGEKYKCYCQKDDVTNIEFVINGSFADAVDDFKYDKEKDVFTK